MISLTDRASLRGAITDPRVDPHLRAVLRLRFEQLGGAGAHFHVLQDGDTLALAEAAIGWPLTMESSPCWEWAERHPGGLIELVFILSDDGPAQVLIAQQGIDPSIDELIAVHA